MKVGGDLAKSKLKGAIAEDELLAVQAKGTSCFVEADPREGFSVRNFQIQATKMAMVSDIVVYRDSDSSEADALDLAKRLSGAQRTCREKRMFTEDDPASFHTYVVDGEQNPITLRVEQKSLQV